MDDRDFADMEKAAANRLFDGLTCPCSYSEVNGCMGESCGNYAEALTEKENQ